MRQSLRRLYVSVLERLDSAPGVVSAAVTNAVPLAGLQPGQTRFQIQGRTYDDAGRAADRRRARRQPAILRHAGHSVRRGRAFTELDHEDAHARGRDQRGDGAALGRPRSDRRRGLVRRRRRTGLTVVGVVGDVKAFGLDSDAVAQIYRAAAAGRAAWPGGCWCARPATRRGATALIRDAVRAVDPDLPIENVRTLDEIRDDSAGDAAADRDCCSRCSRRWRCW